MGSESKRDALFYACVAVLSAILAALSIWALAAPHRPLEYMVAGTLTTSISLLATFLWLMRRGTRKNGGSEVASDATRDNGSGS